MVVAPVSLGGVGRCLRHRQLDDPAEKRTRTLPNWPGQSWAFDWRPDRVDVDAQILAAVVPDRDLSEDKHSVLDSVDTLLLVLQPWPGWWRP